MILRGGFVLGAEPDPRFRRRDIVVEAGRIAAIVPDGGSGGDVIDARGLLVLPGFVQAHVHTCQTLFRGLADDLDLMDWLRYRIWPLEAAHDRDSLRASVRLSCLELLAGGTTTILDMGTVRHTDVIFEEVLGSGLRATIGKCLMDDDPDGIVPAALVEPAEAALQETAGLARRWHGAGGGRIRCAVSPRFAVSCSEELLREAARLARETGCLVHTHASESRREIELVRRRTGRANVVWLDEVGLLGPSSAIVHAVHTDAAERRLLAERGASVVHCPSSNLKLASGIAPVTDFLAAGINVALGADGAPCNNRLSMFPEMHLAVLLQALRTGPGALAAAGALRMATVGGARALGLHDEIGILEPGRAADIITLDPSAAAPGGDPATAVVHVLDVPAVRHVLVDGRLLAADGRVLGLDAAGVRRAATAELRRLVQRLPAEIAGALPPGLETHP